MPVDTSAQSAGYADSRVRAQGQGVRFREQMSAQQSEATERGARRDTRRAGGSAALQPISRHGDLCLPHTARQGRVSVLLLFFIVVFFLLVTLLLFLVFLLVSLLLFLFFLLVLLLLFLFFLLVLLLLF